MPQKARTSQRNMRQSTLFQSFPSSSPEPPRKSSKTKKSANKQKPKKQERSPSPLYFSSPSRKSQRYSPSGLSTPDEDECVGGIKFESKHNSEASSGSGSESVDLTSGEEDEEEDVKPPATPRRRLRRGTAQEESELDELKEEDDLEALVASSSPVKSQHVVSDSEEARVASRRKRERPPSVIEISDSEDNKDDSEEEEEPQPRRVKRRLEDTQKARSTTEEEGEEEDSLVHEVDEDVVMESRMRSRVKKTAYQKALERLKQRKQGKPDLTDSDSQEEQGSDAGSESDERSAKSKPFKGARPANATSSSNDDESDSEDEEEDNFIVEDDDQDVVAELPEQFSMSTHQDLVHHFKTIFQFFVHIAVQPDFYRSDFMKERLQEEPYFSQALFRARSKLSGIRDLRVASSTFKPKFVRLLERHPNLSIHDMEFGMPGCDACNLRSRVSTKGGLLTGKPYDRMGFVPLPEDSDSEDSEDEDNDEEDDRLYKPNKENIKALNLGRVCARRVKIFHDLSHWEHALFTSIDEEVALLRKNIEQRAKRDEKENRKKGKDKKSDKSQKNMKQFVRVAREDGLLPPENLEDADGLVEWFDSRNVIDYEWQKIREMMQRAEGVDAAWKKGEED